MSIFDETDEALGTVLLLAVVVVAVLLYMAWKHVSIAGALYSLFSRIASGIDQIFAGSPISGGPVQHTVDHGLGGVGSWLAGLMPAPPKQPDTTPQEIFPGAAGINTGINSDGSINWGTGSGS